MALLFLDDNLERHKSFMRNHIGESVYQVFDYQGAVVALTTQPRFDVAYLDHDLSDLAASGAKPQDEKTGTDVANFIASMPEDRRPIRIVVHSYNPIGADRIAAIVRDANIPVVIVPFSNNL